VSNLCKRREDPGKPGGQLELFDGADPRVLRRCSCALPVLAKPTRASRPETSMSATNGGPGDGPQPQMAMPQIGVLAQYVKDFSFENPNAPRSMAPTGQQPTINIQVNVDAAPMSDTDFEVTLRLEGKAESQGMLLFGFELVFAGAFRVQNVPPDSLQPVVLIECPRLLFPFAREIVATAVRNGGFAPLLLDPIDFVALYRQRLAATQPSPSSQPLNPN
jgi:preprotein translocase subunit SecB